MRTKSGASQNKSVLYIQFTNPTAYPPLEHSAILLNRVGWEIFFAGVRWNDSGDFEFPDALRANLSLITAPKPGWKRKLFYARFTLHAFLSSLRLRPSWVYVSDPMATPAGLLIRLIGFRVIYHEHDFPGKKERSIDRVIMACRKKLARTCSLNIVPQETRRTLFIAETQTRRPVLRVWNCPRREEVSRRYRPVRERSEPLGIYYHGSITLERVPLALINAAGESGCPVLLRVVGYETIGSKGATARLKRAAQRFSKTLRLETPGPQTDRDSLFRQMQAMHVGWIAFNEDVDDINLRYLAGASNKAFDYLAAGLSLLVNDSSEWTGIFGITKTAVSCNINDTSGLAEKIRWAYNNPEEIAEMGERGRQLILSEFNYLEQFRPVMKMMTDGAGEEKRRVRY